MREIFGSQNIISRLPLGFIAGCVAIFIWGTSPAATYIAAQDLTALSVGAMRTIGAGILLLPLIVFLKLKPPACRIGWTELLVNAVIGFLAGAILMTIGVSKTSTAHAGLILAAAPILTGLFGFILSQDWPRKWWWGGALIAIAGQTFLIFSKNQNVDDIATIEGDLILVVSLIFISAGYVAGGRVAKRIGTWAGTSWALVIASVILMPFISFWWPSIPLGQVNPQSLYALGGIILFITIIGFALWFWALDRDGAAKIAPIQFTQPIVSLIIAVLVLSEPITMNVFVATIAILFGVVVCRKNTGA